MERIPEPGSTPVSILVSEITALSGLKEKMMAESKNHNGRMPLRLSKLKESWEDGKVRKLLFESLMG